jgi:hypothetical protein
VNRSRQTILLIVLASVTFLAGSQWTGWLGLGRSETVSVPAAAARPARPGHPGVSPGDRIASLNVAALDGGRPGGLGARDPWRFVDPPPIRRTDTSLKAAPPQAQVAAKPRLPHPEEFTLRYLGRFGPAGGGGFEASLTPSGLFFGLAGALLQKSLPCLEDLGRALPDQLLHPIVIVVQGYGEQENEALMGSAGLAVEAAGDDPHDTREPVFDQGAALDLDHAPVGAGPPGLQAGVHDGMGAGLESLHQRGRLLGPLLALSRAQLLDGFSKGPILPGRLKNPDDPRH